MRSLILLIPKIFNKILMILLKGLFSKSGKNVTFYPLTSFFSYKTIELGNDVFIGPRAYFSSIKKISIGNKVMFGPNVTIIGGDHNTSEIGKYMFDVENKKESDDIPVKIGNDVWVGTRVTILKGVEIGDGAIIAAGSLVLKNVEPYSIYGGVPAKKLKMRFENDDLKKHLNLLNATDE